MDKKKVTIIMASASLILTCILGGFIYFDKKVEAQEKQEREILFAQIDKQQAQEEKAKELKSDAPTVSVEPAKAIKEEPKYEVAPPVVKDELKQEAPKQEVKKETSTSNKVDSTPVTKEVSKKEVSKGSQEIGKAITTLSDADINRLKRYKQYSTIGSKTAKSYSSFEKMYTDEKANCDALMEKFSALTLSDYNKAKVDWLTSPKLVYYSAASQYCVRGIISLTYYGENKFGLTPNQKYQRDVEYRLRSSVKNGGYSLDLESIHYLSDFKVVK